MNVQDDIDSQEDDVKVKVEKSDDSDEVKEIIDDDDDDVIEITPQEPVITEILDEEDEVAGENVLVDDAKNEQTDVVADAIAPETNGVTSGVQEENKTNESDFDVQIQEPNIPITDLDEIEDTPISIAIGDDSVSHGSPFAAVKIKEEPKDEDEEEDAFEEVGIVCPVENLENNISKCLLFSLCIFNY